MIDTKHFSSKRLVFVLVLLLLWSFFSSNKLILSIPNHGSITEKEKAPPEKAPPPPPPADVAINRNSPHTLSDVTRITHIPSETRIEVHLNATRRCQNPVFKGRISGWSLSMIEFDAVSDNVVVGKYDLFHMPRSGKYYVEILLVLCEGYSYGEFDAFQFLNLRNVSLEVNQDGRHQITAGNGTATIDIDIDVSVPVPNQHQHLTSQAKKFRGRWLHRSLVTIQKTLITDENLTQPVPLFTAVQCNGTQLQCQDMHTRKSIFREYTFLWNSGPDAVLNQPGISGMIQTQQKGLIGGNITELPNHNHSTDVCFVGASHSRELANACNDILKTTREIAEREKLDSPLLDGFDCQHWLFHFPPIPPRRKAARHHKFLTNDKVVKIGRKGCTHVVLGLFQWYFGYENFGDPDVTFDEWKSGMTKVVQSFRALNQSSIRKVYFRSAHPNGFNFRHTSQPPKDWRTPVNSKFATQILQEIVNELETTSKNESGQLPLISFMDTDVVMDPVWESARDWSHYASQFMEAEIKFILSTIMNDDRSGYVHQT